MVATVSMLLRDIRISTYKLFDICKGEKGRCVYSCGVAAMEKVIGQRYRIYRSLMKLRDRDRVRESEKKALDAQVVRHRQTHRA